MRRLVLALAITFLSPAAFAAIPASERAALDRIYASMGGDEWPGAGGWKGAAGTECKWEHITCDAAGEHVIALTPRWQKAKGSIPREIAALTRLEVLRLDGNDLTGVLPPEIGSLASLRVLNLDGHYSNDVSGPIPRELGQLTNLRELILIANKFTGPIPAELANLHQLETLDLSYNPLSAPIPAALFTLPKLKTLALRRIGATGALPAMAMPALQKFDVGENALTGTIPPSLTSLSSLEEVRIDDTRVSGPLPADLNRLTKLTRFSSHTTLIDGELPNFSGLSAMVEFRVYRTNIHGSLPSSIGEMRNLEEISLNDKMSGALPDALFTLPKLEEFRASGGITGNLADFARLPALRFLELRAPGFPGPFPLELTRAANLARLVLDGVPLEGAIPPAIANLTKLELIELRNNRLTSLPEELTTLTTLEDVRMVGTKLTALPATLGRLTNLDTFIVGDSPITGTLPAAEIGKLKKLQNFYVFNTGIEGPIPPEVFSSPDLIYVDLHGNNLGGPMPGVAATPKLISIHVGDNQLTALPPDVASLRQLSYLHAGGNEMSGPLPSTLLQLTNLDQLILLGNHFGGPILDFRPLTKLVNLRLEKNQLSGPIPDSLGEISTLRFVHLWANKLSGRIPFNVTTLPRVQNFFIGDNALYSDDPAVRAFLAARDPRWEHSQTRPPTGLTVLAQRETSVTLRWDPPQYIFGPGGYRVAYSRSVNGPFSVITTTPDKRTTSFIVDSLDRSTNYFFQVTTVTYPHDAQQNVVVSEPGPTLAASTTLGQPAAPAVVVYRYPYVIAQRLGGTSATNLILGNAGDLPATVTLTQSGVFFTASPTSFTIPGGGVQTVTLAGLAQSTVRAFDGQLMLSGSGVPPGMSISVQMIVSEPPSGIVTAQPNTNRIDVAAPAAEGTSGTVVFRNTGTGTLQGIVTSNVPWIIPPKDLIVIPPGESRTVTFTIDQSKRPDASSPAGAVTGTLSLVFDGGGAGVGTFDTGATVPSTSIVTVVYTVSPPINSATIPTFGANEVAYFVPGVGHVLGSNNRLFISDISIVNVFGIDSPKDIRMFFTPADPAATSTATNVQALEPNQGVTFANVVKTVFASSNQGTIQIRTASIDKLFVSANILNVSDLRGTYGTNIPIFRSDRALSAGQSLWLSGLRRNASRSTYTNIFIQETSGNTATWLLEFFNAAGQQLPLATGEASLTGTVAPFRLAAVLDRAPVGAVAARLSQPSASGGRIVGYATPIDNESGDFWTVVDWNRETGSASTEPVIIPVAGSLRGALNTFFRTDVSVTNPTSSVGSANLRFYDRRGHVRDREFTLAALETRTFEDVIGTSFPDLGDTAGYIELTPNGSASVTSRTFATVPTLSGTYGTGVPALPRSAALYLGQSLIIGGLDVASPETIVAAKPGTFRTNIGLVEISGQSATVEVTVIYNDIKQFTSGIRVARLTFDLLPHQSRIENLATLIRQSNPNVADLRGVQLQFKVTGGDGAIIVYTSSVDNGTADQVLRTQ